MFVRSEKVESRLGAGFDNVWCMIGWCGPHVSYGVVIGEGLNVDEPRGWLYPQPLYVRNEQRFRISGEFVLVD